MKRNININQLRQLQPARNVNGPNRNGFEPEQSCSSSSSTIRPSTSSMIAPPRLDNGPRVKGEEIAAMLMQAAEKADRCWNFDLDHWLSQYERARYGDVNFPEAGILIQCAAQIYGRKVDYLMDIILHMSDDQKTRERKTQEEQKASEGGEEAAQEQKDPAPVKPTGRKRAGKFNPQSLSDCFGDLEFTCNDKKLAKLESLIKPIAPVDVDRRTKVQQMQDLCTELRANPNRQRRQEILNRLRDDACIAPILSSNGAALKHQILDLESGETIGTRYDYQIHLNYIDGRTGSLLAEHDLKRFFQRCDVMDFLLEQHVSERERCTRLGMPAPTDMLAQRERELKLYMPPEYLNDRYRIKLNNTSDFDNALFQTRLTNYSSDPILSLMDPGAVGRAKLPAADVPEERKDALDDNSHKPYDSGTQNDSGIVHDTTAADEDDLEPSFIGVLSSTRPNESTLLELDSTAEQSSIETDKSTSQEALTVENEAENTTDMAKTVEITDPKRLSVDEGIGVDRESPPRSGALRAVDVEIKTNDVIFTGGMVFPRPPAVLRPVRLVHNLLGIPEDLARKHVQFALPMEYRKMKAELVKRQAEQKKAKYRIEVHSLKPTPESLLRPSTPEPEDFLGFEDEPEQLQRKENNKRTKTATPSAETTPTRQNRSATPEPDFEGFDEEEILSTRKAIEQWLKQRPEKQKLPISPKRMAIGSSLPVTPTRTLSCDSGISDSGNNSGKNLPCVTPPGSPPRLDPLPEEDEAVDSGAELLQDAGEAAATTTDNQAEESPTTGNLQPRQEHTDASNARIQQSMLEAKERFDKVSQWHRKLKPILIESEKRNHFDIHEYGTEIIDTFDPAVPLGGEVVTLERILQNRPPHSTARFFLSMLMLANTNNVQISNTNQDALRLSTAGEIELRLLSRKRHHEELEALGELLPANGEEEHPSATNRTKHKNRKRKIAFEEQWPVGSGERADGLVPRLDHARLHGGLDETGSNDDGSFLDNVQQLYADLNSEESQRKRMAFRRGMRSCAYGLDATVGGEAQAEPTPSPRVVKGCKPSPQCVTRPCPSVVEPPDDLLTVDLLTNHATLVPARDPDASCAKSLFSLAESGYESMLC